MRLINTISLKLEEFNEANRPPYAILSHTWGDDEITFQQMQDNTSRYYSKVGYQKILMTCKVALSFNLEYAWVDTCCIDKTSSAELSEAINSMFRWYEDAEICYAYLPDVDDISYGRSTVPKSRWFTRGWTLQELIAPRHLVFYAANWDYIDSRSNFSAAIARATGIDERLLQDNRAKAGEILRSSSIARRMSWASRRQTTRTEDLAYCLLGIFDINMPLLYGEGIKAFTRLQQEIIRHTDDQSIFAWEPTSEPDTNTSILAPSPAAFVESGKIDQVDTGEESAPFSLTNRGIQIDLNVRWANGHPYGIIPCRHHEKPTKLLMIKLQQLNGSRFFRATKTPLEWTSEWVRKKTPKIPVYLMIAPPPIKYRIPPGSFLVKFPSLRTKVFVVSEGYTWSPATRLITMDEPESRFGRKTELRLCLNLRPSGGSFPLDHMSISVWVRWPTKDIEGHEWVTYDMRSSSHKRHLQNGYQHFWPFFAKVERQVVFGQQVIVIEVFSWKTQSVILKHLQLARICLDRLVDRYIFGTLPVGVAWSGILLLELTQEAILFKPVLIVAASVIIWPIQDPGVELWSIEGIKDMILPSIQVKPLVFGALYLMAFWLSFIHSLYPASEVLLWTFIWPSLSSSANGLPFWMTMVGTVNLGRSILARYLP